MSDKSDVRGGDDRGEVRVSIPEGYVRADLELLLVAVVKAIAHMVRTDEEEDREEAVEAIERLAGAAAVLHSRHEIPEELWQRHNNGENIFPGMAPDPRFVLRQELTTVITKTIMPASRTDRLVVTLIGEALDRLHKRDAVELWPDTGEPKAIRATSRAALLHPDLPPMAQPRKHTAELQGGTEDPEWPATLTHGEKKIVELLWNAKGAFVTANVIEQAHGGRTRAPAIAIRLNQKLTDVCVESASRARKNGDPAANGKTGYRLVQRRHAHSS